MGGQMWYVQSRMRENNAKNQPIPGFPMNAKAAESGRFYCKDDANVNEGSTAIMDGEQWKAIQTANPPVV
jgi:hypothetical protein